MLEVPVANVLDCDIVVSEFELRSRYYIQFRTSKFGKRKNSHKLVAFKNRNLYGFKSFIWIQLDSYIYIFCVLISLHFF